MAKSDLDTGRILATARQRSGMPQADLVRRMKFSVAEVAHIEAGHTLPSIRTAE